MDQLCVSQILCFTDAFKSVDINLCVVASYYLVNLFHICNFDPFLYLTLNIFAFSFALDGPHQISILLILSKNNFWFFHSHYLSLTSYFVNFCSWYNYYLLYFLGYILLFYSLLKIVSSVILNPFTEVKNTE